jgi:rubrerythrin
MTDDLDFASASQALAGLERLDVPAMELMYKLECSGEDFYNLLADRIGNEEAATLFRRNAKEELGHARRIARAIAIKQGRAFEPSAELQERYAVALPDTIDPAMLPFIVAGEQAGDAGYQAWADNESDPEVARLLRLNGREETLHGERVTQEIAILEGAPAS